MTPLNEYLEKAIEICEKATPGPWNHYHSGILKEGVDSEYGFICCAVIESDFGNNPNNMKFIASARTSLPKLAKALQEAVGSIRDWIEDWKSEDPSLTRDNIRYAENLLEQISSILGLSADAGKGEK